MSQIEKDIGEVGHRTKNGQVISTLRSEASPQVPELSGLTICRLYLEVIVEQLGQVLHSSRVLKRLIVASKVHQRHDSMLSRLKLSVGIASIAKFEVHVIIVLCWSIWQVY